MSAPSSPEPRFGNRYGCVVVVLVIATLVACLVWAVRRPVVGIPALIAALGVAAWLMRYAKRREDEEGMREVARLHAITAPNGAAWRALLAAEGLGTHAELLGGLVRPALRLVTQRAANLAVGQSRMGGSPDLPADVAWAVHQGKPLTFLAQLDLAEMKRAWPESPLPSDGHLWFFYAASEPWGFDPKDAGSSVVVFRPAGAPLAPRRAPPGLEDGARFEACSVRAEPFEDLPELDQNHPLHSARSEAEDERYLGIREYLSSGGAERHHKLLGFADTIQGSMELECELVTNGIYCGDPKGYADPRAKELEKNQTQWRLLLQLDSDEAAAMMWGDLGRLYFWIREGDLREQRFDRTWTILQCH